MNRQLLEQIARENIRLIGDGAFLTGADERTQRDAAARCRAVNVITPVDVTRMRRAFTQSAPALADTASVRVIRDDSFEALRTLPRHENALVLNFANAYRPGGGYLFGAVAQEETLCRRSTLYASLSNPDAEAMYAFNRSSIAPEGSDYMLLSPFVTIFRDMNLNQTVSTTQTAVLSAPAPDLDGQAAALDPVEIKAIMQRRVENILLAAHEYGYRTLVLGAWGCGAFRHDAKAVAGYFRDALIGRNMLFLFDTVLFSVYSPIGNYNYNAFRDAFPSSAPLSRQSAPLSPGI